LEDGMIIDNVDNFSRYFSLDPRYKTADEQLKALPQGIRDGKYPISDDMYMMIQERRTGRVDEGSFETHEKYIDIQVVLEGEEVMSFADTGSLSEKQAYDAEKDIALYEGEGENVKVKAGTFYIMYPGEAHKGCCHYTKDLPVKKAVFKIKA
jgi:biofilm protein TabA